MNSFFRLLKSLVVSDIFVALFCGSLWGMPHGVDKYSRFIFTKVAPYLITASHVSVLASNLFTGVLGFERYVRLKYICNFRYKNWITNKNVNYYRLAIITFATLFYVPKFFELTPVHVTTSCAKVVSEGYIKFNQVYIQLIKQKFANENVNKTSLKGAYPSQDEYNLDSIKDTKDCIFDVVTFNQVSELDYFTIGATTMRKNWTYYLVYYLGANTIIGHLLPFALITILNIWIVLILRKTQRDTFSIVTRPSVASSASTTRHEVTVSESISRRAALIVIHQQNQMLNGQTIIHLKQKRGRNFRLVSCCYKSARNSHPRPSDFEESDFSRRPSNVEDDLCTSPVSEDSHENDTDVVKSSQELPRASSQNGLVRHGGGRQTAQDKKLAWISIYILVMYLVSHSWKFIPNCYDAIYGSEKDGEAVLPTWPKWLYWVKDFAHIMVVCNSAFNFIPYLWFKC